MTDPSQRLELESYYDAVPRSRADTEEIGPFTLFIARSGWPFYARPRLGEDAEATEADVRRVLDRQRELSLPLAFEWVSETTPALEDVIGSVGMSVLRAPLLVLDGQPRGTAGTARMLGADELDEVSVSRAAISVAFDAGGTHRGDEGIAERDASVGKGFSELSEASRAGLASGLLRAAACYAEEDPGLGPVGGGSHSPVGGVTEIAGVGVLPAFRRRGLAGALTHVLAADALASGVSTVFCSAQNDDVARVYEGIGFRRVGVACIASLDESGPPS
jgi:ribosomal protein S18 acetylase RimI-like enzyme